MSEPPAKVEEDSLIAAGRDELTGGFHPLRLWRDRRRVLAEPVVAARPNPPLANAPLRFSLALHLTPILLISWLVGLIVDLTPNRPPALSQLEVRSVTLIEAIEPELGGLSREAVFALGKRRQDAAPDELKPLQARLRELVVTPPTESYAERRARVDAWVRDVRASSLPEDAQRQLLANGLSMGYRLRNADVVLGRVQRNAAEGGPVLQVSMLLAALLGAWLFRQTLQGDARFVHAARADRFYLYYSTSRMFWFIPLQTLAYGVGAYGSALGRNDLLHAGQVGSTLVGAAAMVWVLLGSRQMARALSEDPQASLSAAWAVGWRQLAAMVGSFVLLAAVAAVLAVVVAIAAAALE